MSVVDINGHKYRYKYNKDTGQTEYVGPVGDGPALTEEEFLRVLIVEGTLQLEMIGETVSSTVLNVDMDRDFYLWAIKDGIRSEQFQGKANEFAFDFIEKHDQDFEYTKTIAREIGTQIEELFKSPQFHRNKKAKIWEVSTHILDEDTQEEVLRSVAWSMPTHFDKIGYRNTLNMIELMSEVGADQIADSWTRY